MIEKCVLDGLKGRNLVLFVADKGELAREDVPFPIVYTGIGKMRMYGALETWYAGPGKDSDAVVLNVGSAGSARFPIGEMLDCRSFINGGSELIYDRIDLPGKGCSVFSGDYFMSTQTFSPEQVKSLSGQYDLFDMEAYAAACFCRSHRLDFRCFKAVSDNLDGSIKDWRKILGDIREKFTALLSSL